MGVTTLALRVARRRVARRRRRSLALDRLSGRVNEVVGAYPIRAVLVLIALTVLMAVLLARWPDHIPWVAFTPIIVFAGLFLTPRRLLLVVVVTAVLLAYDWWLLREGDKPNFLGATVVVLLVAAMMMWLSRSRDRLGVQGTLGESMLVDLRDRLRAHGELPTLPDPWQAEAAVKPAHGESFSGDFVVATTSNIQETSVIENLLEVALVDVSGKGLKAGTRALLLSGAFGGLLGAMEPDDFLGAANSYLVRQDWGEGFATAIHLVLELDTGRFSLGGAGHPPAVKFSAGSGLWQILDAKSGPLLGVVRDADFPRTCGELNSGDALLLYTDGVIETRTRDLKEGIDRMLGAAERLISTGFEGGASMICEAPLDGETDDRAVVLIWRR